MTALIPLLYNFFTISMIVTKLQPQFRTMRICHINIGQTPTYISILGKRTSQMHINEGKVFDNF